MLSQPSRFMFGIGAIALACFSLAAAESVPPSSLALFVSSENDEARRAVELGMRHLLTSWDEAAFAEFARARKLDPSCAMATWGLLLSSLGSDHDAERADSLAALRKIVRERDLLPQEQSYCEALALLLVEGPVSAAECMRRCAERFRRDPTLRMWEIVFLRNGYDLAGHPRREQERALQLAEELLRAQPDEHAALFLRALLEETAPAVSPRAIECARRAVELAPSHPVSRQLLGHLLARANRFVEAAVEFRRARELYVQGCAEIGCRPDDDDGQIRALLSLATAQWQAGDRRASLQTRRKLASLAVNTNRPRSRRSRLLIWEARSLPARIALAETTLPDTGDVKACLKAAELPGMPDEDPARDYLACLRWVMESRVALSQRKRFEASACLERAQKALDALLSPSPGESGDRDAACVARAVEACRIAIYRTRGLLNPSSAPFWRQDADETARPSSSLLPPVMP